MSKFIITHIDNPYNIFGYIYEISQIVYREERLIQIMYESLLNRVIVQDQDEYYFISHPNIPVLSIRLILQSLGYSNNQIVVTYVEKSNQTSYNLNILDRIISDVPYNHIYLYHPNQPLPSNRNSGPFPTKIMSI